MSLGLDQWARQNIRLMVTPTDDRHLVTKQYVDAVANNLLL